MPLASILGQPNSTEISLSISIYRGRVYMTDMAEQPTYCGDSGKTLSSTHTVRLPFELGRVAWMTQTCSYCDINTSLNKAIKALVSWNSGFVFRERPVFWTTLGTWDRGNIWGR